MVVALSEKQRKHLRRLGHSLHPLVTIGAAGLTHNLVTETERALHDHELIKVRARNAQRAARDALFADLAGRTGSELVQRVGHVALLYRRRAQLPKILIPEG
jgi:RNA-binding protein